MRHARPHFRALIDTLSLAPTSAIHRDLGGHLFALPRRKRRYAEGLVGLHLRVNGGGVQIDPLGTTAAHAP
jgi:hypothetical protein